MSATIVGTYRAMAFNNAWANHRLLAACARLTQEEFEAARTGFFPEHQGDAQPHPDRRLVLRRWPRGRLARPEGVGQPDALRHGGGPAARAGGRRSAAHCRLRCPDGAIAWRHCAPEPRYARPDRAPRPVAPASVPAPDPSSRPGPCHALGDATEAAPARRVLFRGRGAAARLGVCGAWMDRRDGVGASEAPASRASPDRGPSTGSVCPMLQRGSLLAGQHGSRVDHVAQTCSP